MYLWLCTLHLFCSLIKKKKQNENISYYSSGLYGVGFMFFSVYGAGLTWVLSWKQESFMFERVELFKLRLISTYWNKWKLIELFKLKGNPGHFSVYLMSEVLDTSIYLPMVIRGFTDLWVARPDHMAMVFYSGVNSYSGNEAAKCMQKAKVKSSQNFHLKYWNWRLPWLSSN